MRFIFHYNVDQTAYLDQLTMPTTTRVGQESAANKVIGGIPVVHYFDFKSRGRGQSVRLLWEDAGIAYDDIVWLPQ